MNLPFSLAGPLRTDRLVLRPVAPDDLAYMRRVHGDTEVSRWLMWHARTAAEAEAAHAAAMTRTRLAADGDVIQLALELAATREVVGDVVLILTSVAHRGGEVGYIVDPRHQGRGYATEAVRALLAVAFEEIGLHRVIGRLEPRNGASGRVLERAGMRREALLVENEWIKDEWQSEAIYAILEREWLTTPRAAP